MALDKCCNTPSTFIHSCSFWPAYLFHWLCSTSAAAFLPPTHQPKLSSLAYLQPVLSPSLPVSDSCLHTASYTRHCFSSQHHPAFPGSPLRCGRRAQGRGSSHVLCEDAWQKVESLPCLSVLSHQYYFSRYCWLQERLSVWCCKTLQSDLCVAPVQCFLAGGCPQPPPRDPWCLLALLYWQRIQRKG